MITGYSKGNYNKVRLALIPWTREALTFGKTVTKLGYTKYYKES
jgi:hypothetical protein